MKSGSWDSLWPPIVAVIIVKMIGLVGCLVALGYYRLKSKLRTYGAVADSGVIGVAVAIVLLEEVRQY